jgi:putative methionine-R-sulfoxide reductase with GAF domain
MKKSRIKIIAIVLFVLQLALGVKSILIIQKILGNQDGLNLAVTDKLLLFAGFLAGVLVSIALVILVFSSLASDEKKIADENEKEAAEKKKKAKGKVQNGNTVERSEEKRRILEKLNLGLEGISEIEKFTEKVLINISKIYDIMQGIFFVKDLSDKVFKKKGAYAYYSEDELREFSEEVGLSGQVAANKKLLNISNIPEKYLMVLSGLGKSSPANLLILPVIYKNESIGIIELASFKKFDSLAEEILTDFTNQINDKLAEINEKKEPTVK